MVSKALIVASFSQRSLTAIFTAAIHLSAIEGTIVYTVTTACSMMYQAPAEKSTKDLDASCSRFTAIHRVRGYLACAILVFSALPNVRLAKI